MLKSSLSTPIVLLVFNRPDTTAKVFEVIRQVKPKKLLVVADGPRSDKVGEAERCAEVRAIIDTVDWDCEVLKNYSEVNLGSYKRNSSGLSWAFDTVGEAIMLEDDCVPHISFFRFCEELLDYYRSDERVGLISGNNFQSYKVRESNYSYFFSKYNHTWGWATWRRTWKQIDWNMSKWIEFCNSGGLSNMIHDYQARLFLYKIFKDMYKGKRKLSWDIQLQLACYMYGNLCIKPKVNLVSNIGFGKNATHTKNTKSPFAHFPIESINFPLQHSTFIFPSKKMDQEIEKIQYNFFRRALRKVIKSLI